MFAGLKLDMLPYNSSSTARLLVLPLTRLRAIYEISIEHEAPSAALKSNRLRCQCRDPEAK